LGRNKQDRRKSIHSRRKVSQAAAGRPLRLDAQQLTDGELLAKLHSFGIDLDRASLGRLCEETLSAEEIARPLLESRTFKTRREAMEGDWIWICLVGPMATLVPG